MTEAVYTTEEVATHLRICTKTVRKLVKTGLLKPMHGIKRYKFTETAIKRYTGKK